MKMQLTTDSHGRVTIAYDDEWGDRVERTFIAPPHVGYVRELTDGGGTKQPCEALARTGSTLISDRDTLAATIRREYRKMRQREAKV